MSMDMDTEICPTDDAELYRMKKTTSEPLVDHKHLEFINVYSDERIMVGAANLTTRSWNGSVWVYDNSSAFEKEEAFVSVSTESVICDAVFLEQDKFVVVEDSGVLQVFSITDDRETTKELKAVAQCVGYTCQHDGGILSVSAFENKDRLVSAGMDCCIKVWNTAELLAERSYDGAHRKIVTCVEAKPKDNDVFASSSFDCEAILWDTRKEHAAEVIYEMPGRQLTAVAWSQNDDNLVTVGGIDGSIVLLDIRKPRDFVSHSQLFQKSIRKLQYDSNKPHLLAACCDDTEVNVVDDTKNFASTYHDKSRHSDYVRGVAWCNKNLLSCSWDNTVVKHEIPASGQPVVK